MHIVISQSGRKAEAVAESVLEYEAELQKFLDENLDRLPWSEIEPDLKLLQLGREFPTRLGRREKADLLAIDEDGNFYVVETKLEKNADKRQVIAQALDYGASIWSTYPNGQGLIDALDATYQLKERARTQFAMEDSAVAEIVRQIETNVAEGRIRFVVVMDAISEELKDLMSFINKNSNFQLYLVDLKFFKHAEIEVVVPTIHGVETAKLAGNSSRSAGRRALTPEEFESRIPDALAPDDRELVARLARVTANDTNYRSTPSGFFAETRAADPVELYYLTPMGEIRLRLPGPGSGATALLVHEAWKAALIQAGFDLSKAPVDRGKGWSLQLADWKPLADRLMATIKHVASLR
jgi:hypothetical protein